MIYLLTQIFLCLLVALLLGVLLGWLLWGRARAQRVAADDGTSGDESKAIASLQADLAACRDAQAASEGIAAASSAAKTSAVAAGTVGLFGPVSETTIDDLRRISGVGPVIEKQLAGIGITTYQQIAYLSDDDIETVQDAINFFPGRIQQEDWKSQAATLHHEKYGDAA